MKGLGLRLQKARKAGGLTQQELCQRSGLSYSTLAKIERGAIKSPSIFTIQQIAAVLDITVDELLGAPKVPVIAPKQTSKSGVSFVYFDIHGCIVQFFHRAFVSIAKDTGVSPDIVESMYWHYNDAVCRGEMSLEDFSAAFGTKFDIPDFDWTPYYLEALTPIKETHELIRWAAQHYRVGLLSNIFPGMLERLKANGMIPNIEFDSVIDSSVVASIKPEAAIFEVAAKQADVPPGQILLVDDSRANLMAADRAGWRALWFDDYRPEESTDRVRQALEF